MIEAAKARNGDGGGLDGRRGVLAHGGRRGCTLGTEPRRARFAVLRPRTMVTACRRAGDYLPGSRSIMYSTRLAPPVARSRLRSSRRRRRGSVVWDGFLAVSGRFMARTPSTIGAARLRGRGRRAG